MMIYNRATIIIQSHASGASTHMAEMLRALVRIDQDPDYGIVFWTKIGYEKFLGELNI